MMPSVFAVQGNNGDSSTILFQSGYQARVDGQPVSDAPKVENVGSSLHHAWIEGWDAANASLPKDAASAYRAVAGL